MLSGRSNAAEAEAPSDRIDNDTDGDHLRVASALPTKVIVVKVGGSSITDKGTLETLQPGALEWLSHTMRQNLDSQFLAPDDNDATHHADQQTLETGTLESTKVAYILVHGAGSFGHFHATKYGLRGVDPFSPSKNSSFDNTRNNNTEEERTRRQGLALTRQSVQKLNQLVVQALVRKGINAVGISPGIWSNNRMLEHSTIPDAQQLRQVVFQTLHAGLVPVLHGDGCIWQGNPGILSGDAVVQLVADTKLTQSLVFLTDVPGVFTADPKQDATAVRIPWMHVGQPHDNQANGNEEIKENTQTSILSLPPSFQGWSGAGSSTHEHDVTGGLATKLNSAVSIVQETNFTVAIAYFGSTTAERLLSETQIVTETTEEKDFEGTILFPKAASDV